MSQWTMADIERLNAKRGAKMPAHVGVHPSSPQAVGAGQTGDTITTAGWSAQKKSKYRNVKTLVDGIIFDSKKEANYWLLLKAQEAAGEIHSLQRQVVLDLCCPITPRQSAVVARYVADFVYKDQKQNTHVVDAKGKRTQMYALKKKWLELQSGIIIEEV